jgi:alpha 1,3-mannosyltransferase
VLDAILNRIVVDAALQCHPNAETAKDRDIECVARQTAVLNDLLKINKDIAPTNPVSESFRDTINRIQKALYPWITMPKAEGSATYGTIFDLIDSYTQEVGIVIATGSGGFRWAVHQIVTLRAVLKSTLPIEVVYAGDNDLPSEYRNFIESLESTFPSGGSITTVDLLQKFADPEEILGLPGGWAIRPFAILASSFKIVLLTDADVVFLQDPRILLNEPGFESHGSIFWHDRRLYPASRQTYEWVDELLESARAKNMEEVRDAGWFRRETYFEQER